MVRRLPAPRGLAREPPPPLSASRIGEWERDLSLILLALRGKRVGFREPGADEVNALWQDRNNRLAVCVLTIPELKTRLLAETRDRQEAERAFGLYVDQLTVGVPFDRPAADEAVRLRESARSRLPLVGACIAACARRVDCVLVHRDPHLDAIPAGSLRQLRLPDKA